MGLAGQWFVIKVEGSQVVDVPQQVDPAALLGTPIGQRLGWW